MAKVVSRADLLMATRAILYMPGLSAAEKAVGCAIIAHFNEDTGQCDPGAARLAKLLGVHRALVFRAVAKLVELKIIDRTRFGGKSHRNSYGINWRRCGELHQEANRRTTRPVKASPQPSHHETGEPSHHETANVYLDNGKATYDVATDASGEGARGSAKGSKPNAQRFLVHGIAGRKGASGNDAAQAAAQRRLGRAIDQLGTVQEREAAWLRAMGEA